MNKYFIKEILANYDKKREQAKDTLAFKKEELYKQIPLLKHIDNQIFETGLKMSKAVLTQSNNQDVILKNLQQQLKTLTKRKAEILRENRLPPDYLTEQYDCNICNDKGFLRNGKKCKCLKQEIINRCYQMSNLSKILDKENFSTFDSSIFSDKMSDDNSNMTPRDNILDILSICEEFCMDFEKDKYSNLLFYGTTGLGKTFMSNCIAKDLLDKGYIVIYQTAFKILEIIEDHKFRRGSSSMNEENYQMLFDCDLLIIDDLGTEVNNTFVNSEIFNIVNTRILTGKKTLISTNLSPKDISKIYTDRIFSRIFSSFTTLRFIGKDVRWEQKKWEKKQLE